MDSRNSGAILIYVLSLTALLASALVLTQSETIHDIKRLGAIKKEADARYHVYSGHLLAQKMFYDDQNDSDGVGDKWFSLQEKKDFPIAGGGQISIQIQDANAVPNLNQMTTGSDLDEEYRDMVKSYARKKRMSANYFNAVNDWLDYDNITSGIGGAEKDRYFYKSPSYLPANKPINGYGELRLIEGYRADDWAVLKSSFSLLPEVKKVNVNTIGEEYLKIMFPNNLSGVNKVIGQRKRDPYVALGDFYGDLEAKEVTKDVEVDVRTTYFNVYFDTSFNGGKSHAEALYERKNGRVNLRRLQW